MTEHEPLLLHLTLDSDDGPAERLDAAALDAQVARVLGRHGGELAGADAGRTAGVQRGQRPRRRVAVWLGVAAAVALTSAAAALWLGAGVDEVEPAQERSGAPRDSQPARDALAAPAPEPTPIAPAAEAPVRDDVAPEREPAGERVPARTPDLLARANALRAQNKYRAAQELYLRVAEDPGDVLSAHVALVAAGDLGLKLREPARARRLYERALAARVDGPLAAEAWLGVAASRRAEGQDAEERRALETLLQHHAKGPAATRARQRLDELDAAR